jgi:hypothetical protein
VPERTRRLLFRPWKSHIAGRGQSLLVNPFPVSCFSCTSVTQVNETKETRAVGVVVVMVVVVVIVGSSSSRVGCGGGMM